MLIGGKRIIVGLPARHADEEKVTLIGHLKTALGYFLNIA